MEVNCRIIGIYGTNCYIVRKSSQSTDCVIIDTGLDNEDLANYVFSMKLRPVAVVLTHGHADHIAGLAGLKSKWPDVKVYISEIDAELLTDANRNLSLMTGTGISVDPADILVQEGNVIEEAGLNFEVINTPGHTQGGICLYCREEGILFSGDTLFSDSVGRTDFPGGDTAQLIKSIREKIFVLSDDTVIYPGHGPKTTVGREKEYNPFL
ncbi:MAG: MBL fold metallo-hydrolase [Sedimentisphaerales bacterium]|nr:MBL fold metallo-hydrolase [Sedimentisphaerales bacterium]